MHFAHALCGLSGPDAGGVVTAFVHAQHGVQAGGDLRPEFIPLIRPDPAIRQAESGRKTTILNPHRGGLHHGVDAEGPADQLFEPRPLARSEDQAAMYCDHATTCLHIGFQFASLRCIQCLAGRVEEHDGGVLREVRIEGACVPCPGQTEVVLARKTLELRLGDDGVIVVVLVGNGDNQHLELLGKDGAGEKSQADEDQCEDFFHAPIVTQAINGNGLGAIPIAWQAMRRRTTLQWLPAASPCTSPMPPAPGR